MIKLRQKEFMQTAGGNFFSLDAQGPKFNSEIQAKKPGFFERVKRKVSGFFNGTGKGAPTMPTGDGAGGLGYTGAGTGNAGTGNAGTGKGAGGLGYTGAGTGNAETNVFNNGSNINGKKQKGGIQEIAESTTTKKHGSIREAVGRNISNGASAVGQGIKNGASAVGRNLSNGAQKLGSGAMKVGKFGLAAGGATLLGAGLLLHNNLNSGADSVKSGN